MTDRTSAERLNDVDPDVAEVVRRLRRTLTLKRIANGWTQARLARLIGCANHTVSTYETGRRTPSLPTLVHWAGALGFELELTHDFDERRDE